MGRKGGCTDPANGEPASGGGQPVGKRSTATQGARPPPPAGGGTAGSGGCRRHPRGASTTPGGGRRQRGAAAALATAPDPRRRSSGSGAGSGCRRWGGCRRHGERAGRDGERVRPPDVVARELLPRESVTRPRAPNEAGSRPGCLRRGRGQPTLPKAVSCATAGRPISLVGGLQASSPAGHAGLLILCANYGDLQYTCSVNQKEIQYAQTS